MGHLHRIIATVKIEARPRRDLPGHRDHLGWRRVTAISTSVVDFVISAVAIGSLLRC